MCNEVEAMSKAPQPYVVRQGDHLNKIAFRFGVLPDDVWSMGENRPLRDKRTSPDRLFPGDVLYIPPTSDEGLPLNAGSQNAYTATVPTVSVTLRFAEDGQPLGDQECELRGLPGTSTDVPLISTTSEDGELKVEVPVLVREFEVYFPDANSVFAIRLGDMDPEDEHVGIRKRLLNLGYLHEVDDVEQVTEADDEVDLTEAIAAFQETNDLEVSSTVNDETLKALLDSHSS